MNQSSAPGNDGFTGYFYSACWDIIQADLCAFVLDFFKGTHIPQEIATTTLVPIPKVHEARRLGDYRPISLGNFSGKIISKILAIRLAKLFPDIIDEEQAGFVHDRHISTHIALAQEQIWDLSRKVYGANVMLKLDMAKAYDRLEWRFLLKAMEVFGFSPQSRDLVYRNICNIGYQFRINGEITGFFRPLGGTTRGSPLTTSLCSCTANPNSESQSPPYIQQHYRL